jgi:putative ABC transport system permease protein
MVKYFFKITFRNITRNKSFSIINISGLAIGMASSMLILLWVQNELGYDRFYKNANRLYQLWNKSRGNDGINCWNVTPKPLAMGLKQNYPEIEKATRVGWDEAILFTVGEKKMNVIGTMVDPDFLTMFEFPFISGNVNTALNNPVDIVITEKLARSLFGKEDAMGKVVRLDNKYDHKVSAIMKDLPHNTQFDFQFLLPWSYMRTTGQDDSSWGSNSTRNYALLRPNASIAAVNAKAKNIIREHGEPSWKVESFLYPVSKLRLYSNFVNGVPEGGKIEKVSVFIIIAVFILLIACINFMNMSTARSEKRAREVGIRKVAGARRKYLISQFLGESILLTFFAGMVALMIVQLSMPMFNELTGTQLFVEYGNLYFWICFIGFVLFTGILAGSYPAFFLSSFKPVAVLKGSFKKINALVAPRKALVVLQFAFAITLIVCTIIIEKQTKYAQDRQSGYDKMDLIYIPLAGDMNKNYVLIKNDLINKGIAVAVTRTSAPITEGWSSGGAYWSGQPLTDRTEFNFFNVDDGITKTAGLSIVQGRDFDIQRYLTDSNAAIINETALKTMNLKHPIGEIIDTGAWNTNWHIIGVVKDFILQSPYEAVSPMVIQGPKANWFNEIHIKMNHKNSIAENLKAMEVVFREYNPEYPFEYYFVDDKYAAKFSDEQTVGKLTAFFSGLTIFISCLGLFGLAAYMAENRIKEIGIRKVLGASVAGIVALLSKDFIKLVLIAVVVASPVAWWAMTRWLSGYPYRISISWTVFFAAGIIAVVIALATVGFQAIKAAIANPVKSLKAE